MIAHVRCGVQELLRMMAPDLHADSAVKMTDELAYTAVRYLLTADEDLDDFDFYANEPWNKWGYLALVFETCQTHVVQWSLTLIVDVTEDPDHLTT